MLIRSQNKKCIVNLNCVDMIEVRDCQLRYYSGAENTLGILGTYSTEEKAIKVLDDIFQAYKNLQFVDGITFQMPQDNEV